MALHFEKNGLPHYSAVACMVDDRANMHGGVGGFPLFSVVVCAWSTAEGLRGRPGGVGLAQACPNDILTLVCKGKKAVHQL